MKFYLAKVQILLIFSLFLTNVTSQTNYLPGSVIITPGDTLLGEVDHRTSKFLAQSCLFKQGDNETEYFPFDIEGFRLNDGRYFVSRVVEEDSVFLEFLVNGELDLYYQRRDDEFDCYYIQKEGKPLVLLPYYEEQVANDDRSKDDYGWNEDNYGVASRTSKRHIGLLKYYTQDAPELVARIDDLGRPSHNNMKRIVVDYHDVVCDGESCIVYKEKEPKLRIYPELKYGYRLFIEVQSQGEKKIKPFSTYGFELHVKVPRLNERMFLKTGLLYYEYEITNRRIEPPHIPQSIESAEVFAVPLALEYMWPNGWFRPKISVGTFLNFTNSTVASFDSGDKRYEVKMLPLLQAGANIKLIDKFFLSIEAGYPMVTFGMIYMY